MNITVTVNGQTYAHDVEPRLLLVHYLRDVLGLTGTHVGCETSLCGACTVHLNGDAVKSCTLLAVQADGAEVTTIEGLGAGGGPASSARGLLGRTWPAVWFLYAGDDHGQCATARAPSQPHRGRDPSRPEREFVPLYGLSAHCQCRTIRSAKDAPGLALARLGAATGELLPCGGVTSTLAR